MPGESHVLAIVCSEQSFRSAEHHRQRAFLSKISKGRYSPPGRQRVRNILATLFQAHRRQEECIRPAQGHHRVRCYRGEQREQFESAFFESQQGRVFLSVV